VSCSKLHHICNDLWQKPDIKSVQEPILPKRNEKGKQKQPVLPQPMQADTHEIVHEVVAGSHAAEHVANQFARILFAHLLVP